MKKLVISIWFDPFWSSSFRKSWKRRRYWIAKVPLKTAKGKSIAIQIMDYTIKILWLRSNDG